MVFYEIIFWDFPWVFVVGFVDSGQDFSEDFYGKGIEEVAAIYGSWHWVFFGTCQFEGSPFPRYGLFLIGSGAGVNSVVVFYAD